MINEKIVYCPLCKCPLRQDRKDKHLIKNHLLGCKEFLTDAVKCFESSPSDLCKCPHCKCDVKKSKIAGHFKRVHHDIYLSKKQIAQNRELPGRFLITDEKLPKTTEKCVCGLRVGYISDSSGVYRAYNIGLRGFLTDRHICDGDVKSNSIYAFNAGIVDSNRNRH